MEEKENGVVPTATESGGSGSEAAAPFAIPPLTKSSTGLRRRKELDERDRSLTAKLNEISLQSTSSNTDTVAKTPGKRQNNSEAPKTAGSAGNTTTTPGRARPAPVAMPSPGLRRIRERLGDDAKNSLSSTFKGLPSKEELLAQEQASRAMAEAERSATAAIDAIFAQQEGTLLAMSAALKAEDSLLLDKVTKAVEETTKERLKALSGVSREGDDVLQTAVYWITLARFESTHGREEAARRYLTDGIARMMEAAQNERAGACAAANNATQINALRLALGRMDKKQRATDEAREEVEDAKEKENDAMAKEVSKPPLLPPSAKVNKSPSPRRPRSSNSKGEASVTPTRRSSRIKAKSAEKGKK